MQDMNNQKGYTLIELMIVIAILGIILSIAVPRFFVSIEKSKIAADQATVKTLNQVTPIYRVNAIGVDPFIDDSKANDELLELLVSAHYLSSTIEPQSKGAEFIWDFGGQQWLYYMSSDDAIAPTIYLVSDGDFEIGWSSHVFGNYINESEKNIQLPEGIKSIKGGLDEAAFFEKELESVVLPSSLESIYSHAFYENNLTEVIIPENVSFIGTMSFYNNPIIKITMLSEPEQLVIQDRVFGSGYTHSKLVTDSFKESYLNGGPGTYIWNEESWVKQ